MSHLYWDESMEEDLARVREGLLWPPTSARYSRVVELARLRGWEIAPSGTSIIEGSLWNTRVLTETQEAMAEIVRSKKSCTLERARFFHENGGGQE